MHILMFFVISFNLILLEECVCAPLCYGYSVSHLCSLCVALQDQLGQSSEQPDLIEDLPAHCRGVRLDDL